MIEASAGEHEGGVSEQALIRVQAISGLVFATFLALHLANTLLASAGQGAYDGYQRAVRAYYQLLPVEVVGVLGAAFTHLGASFVRILRRRRRARLSPAKKAVAPSLRVRLHRYAGYYMTAVFVGHVVATRGPALLGHPADFSFLTFSLHHYPAFFYPYYGLFVLAGVYHLAHGVLVALRVVKVRLPGSLTAPGARPFWAFVTVAGVAGVAGVLALGGRFFEVDTHRFGEFAAIYDRVLPASMRPWAR